MQTCIASCSAKGNINATLLKEDFENLAIPLCVSIYVSDQNVEGLIVKVLY